jgi:hypothetical protein
LQTSRSVVQTSRSVLQISRTIAGDGARAFQASAREPHASACFAKAMHFFTSSIGLPAPRYSYST